MEEQELSALLRENIEAADRTTRAVRALTSFIVYEAAYSLAAIILLAFSFFPTLALGEPWWVLTVLAVAVAVVGLIHSFSIAFGELAKSEVPDRRRSIPSFTPSRSPRGAKSGDAENEIEVLPGNCDCGPSTRRGSGVWKIDDSYICKNCSRAVSDYL
ncbi:hypothetical protein N9I02_02060 [Pontimonas sp.]|nr:hypothetical protein [Pontimonas sp.]MDA8887291.1 hypothetical protein [Pontimonas sp.]